MLINTYFISPGKVSKKNKMIKRKGYKKYQTIIQKNKLVQY